MGFVIGSATGFVVDWTIMIGGFGLGMLSKNPTQWYELQLKIFIGLCAVLFSYAFVFTLFCKAFGKRIQVPPKPTQYVKEIYEAARCYFVIAMLTAWPAQRSINGEVTSYTNNLKETFLGDGILPNVAFALVFFLFIDLYTYWKHRLLHTRMFWVFHKNHHSFGDPSTFASFGVSPFESVLTFGPILVDELEIMNNFKLCTWLHGSLIIAQIVLNIYLHCGYTFDIVENTLPKLFINTSQFHNLHHAKTKIHFAELLTLWDYLLNTGATYYNKEKFQIKLKSMLQTKNE